MLANSFRDHGAEKADQVIHLAGPRIGPSPSADCISAYQHAANTRLFDTESDFERTWQVTASLAEYRTASIAVKVSELSPPGAYIRELPRVIRECRLVCLHLVSAPGGCIRYLMNLSTSSNKIEFGLMSTAAGHDGSPHGVDMATHPTAQKLAERSLEFLKEVQNL